MKGGLYAYIGNEHAEVAMLLGWIAHGPVSIWSGLWEWRCVCGREPVMPGRAKHG